MSQVRVLQRPLQTLTATTEDRPGQLLILHVVSEANDFSVADLRPRGLCRVHRKEIEL